ncbi:unnamed protein product [Caenorhabditis auriculariae]|uniref:TIL domain-containing protein n=1 Tax=Caenorhabditis auriculariae TaxID=2777116 RepID=A0A8S1HQ21_9PELO|nr:unnamed protein product [Caenorhabditis auriculariae]
MLQKVTLVASLLIIAVQFSRQEDPSWSEWSVVEGATCNETCGSCGRISQSRTCLGGCTCAGEKQRLQPCNSDLCPFGRPTCCEGFEKTIVGNTFQCL